MVIWDPTMPGLGSVYVAGAPIEYPEGTSWDVAFELTARTTLAWNKWEQPPDPEWPGIPAHEYESGNIILADQWECQGGDVVDFHWYGNYEVDATGQERRGSGIARFHLSIHANAPGIPWCLPEDPEIWGMDVPLTAGMEVFTGMVNNQGSPIYEYAFVLPWPFYQQEGEIYWLDIMTYANDSVDPPMWRWQEAGRALAPIVCPAARQYVPGGTGWESIGWPDAIWSDLAFDVSSVSYGELYLKWSQPPEPYVPDDAYNGWNETSVYFGEQIAADDWVCQNDDPITDVHWWGSFLGWGYTEPPVMPDHFHLHIWTDVPGDPSHPGTVIWEHLCYDYMWRFVGWDFDPRFPGVPPEACFYFECDLPEDAWFYQDVAGDPGVYWLSISACYDSPPDYVWGWKTRPRDPDSQAPDDAVRIFDPTGPVPGSQYVDGEPVYWPDPQHSWDLAFQLTATHEEPGLEPKWQQEAYPLGEGFDAVSNLWWPDWEPPQEVNVVVADDFASDGRDILEVSWVGSYYDDRYHPLGPHNEPYVLDGWLIGIHWAKDFMPSCPPDILFDPPPTVVAVYFAPADAVEIACIFGVDCLGHPICTYNADLADCCLVCTHPDPRLGAAYPYPPGCDGAFQEVAEMRYWLSVQAVTGIEWIPPGCDPAFTGHLPPLDVDPEGRFWGWHNGYEPPGIPGPFDQACVGRIMDFTPYPPDCWDYGNWATQPWLCDTPPELVNMAFGLMASNCPEDLTGDQIINLADLATLLSVYGLCYGDPNFLPSADFDNNGCVGLSDLARLLSVYGQNCPTW